MFEGGWLDLHEVDPYALHAVERPELATDDLRPERLDATLDDLVDDAVGRHDQQFASSAPTEAIDRLPTIRERPVVVDHLHARVQLLERRALLGHDPVPREPEYLPHTRRLRLGRRQVEAHARDPPVAREPEHVPAEVEVRLAAVGRLALDHVRPQGPDALAADVVEGGHVNDADDVRVTPTSELGGHLGRVRDVPVHDLAVGTEHPLQGLDLAVHPERREPRHPQNLGCHVSISFG